MCISNNKLGINHFMLVLLYVLANITGIGKIYGSEVIKNDVVFMKTDRLGVDFKLGKARFKIKDYINGNNVLGEWSPSVCRI